MACSNQSQLRIWGDKIDDNANIRILFKEYTVVVEYMYIVIILVTAAALLRQQKISKL